MARVERQDVEIRQVTLREVRAEAGAGEAEGGELYGLAAVYNRESQDLGGFVETIEPGFFEGVLEDDVRCLWNHNDDLVLGRRKSGTLRLEDGQEGLGIRVKLPDTSWGRDARVSVERGDVDQMSFMFTVKAGGDRWVKGEDGVVRRRLLRGGCGRLYEVSPVTFPAYPQTSVQARGAYEAFNGGRADGETGAQVGGPGEEQMGGACAQARLANRKRKLELEILRGG